MPKRPSADIEYEQFKQRFINESPGLYKAMLQYTDNILPHISTKEGRASLMASTQIGTKRLKEIYRYPVTMTFIEAHAILAALDKTVIIRNPIAHKRVTQPPTS